MPVTTRINHWTLDDAAGLSDQINNADFAWLGAPLYEPAKFNDGAANRTNGNSLTGNEAGEFNPDLMCIDSWVDTDYAVINGRAGDAQRHGQFVWRRDVNNRITIDILEIGLNTRFISQIGGVFNIFTISAGLSWNANTLTYLLFALNRNGIDGGADRRRVYMGNALIANSVVALNAMGGAGAGSYEFLGVNTLGIATWPFDGVIDDPVIFNNTTEIADIIAAREIEGRVVPGGGKLIGNKMINPLANGELMIH